MINPVPHNWLKIDHDGEIRPDGYFKEIMRVYKVVFDWKKMMANDSE